MVDPLELLMVADTMIGAGRVVCEVSRFRYEVLQLLAMTCAVVFSRAMQKTPVRCFLSLPADHPRSRTLPDVMACLRSSLGEHVAHAGLCDVELARMWRIHLAGFLQPPPQYIFDPRQCLQPASVVPLDIPRSLGFVQTPPTSARHFGRGGRDFPRCVSRVPCSSSPA